MGTSLSNSIQVSLEQLPQATLALRELLKGETRVTFCNGHNAIISYDAQVSDQTVLSTLHLAGVDFAFLVSQSLKDYLYPIRLKQFIAQFQGNVYRDLKDFEAAVNKHLPKDLRANPFEWGAALVLAHIYQYGWITPIYGNSTQDVKFKVDGQAGTDNFQANSAALEFGQQKARQWRHYFADMNAPVTYM